MNAVDLLRVELRGSCNLVEEHAREGRDRWLRRALSGTSLPGFIIWHCARILDWGLNTVVRETPELGSTPEWRERVQYGMGHGAGLSAAEADAVAEVVTADDVAAYAAELRIAFDAWLDTVRGTDLDAPVRVREHNQVHPRYTTPAAREEVKGLEGVPVGQFLLRPCTNHIRMHMGELETLAQADASLQGSTA